MRGSGAAATLALVLAAAGCGGGASTAPPQTVPLTPQERRGKALFVRACGGCHTLADAGTSGSVGPGLDAHPWRKVTLGEVIASGPGLMPAEVLTGADADAVAAYVAAVTRR